MVRRAVVSLLILMTCGAATGETAPETRPAAGDDPAAEAKALLPSGLERTIQSIEKKDKNKPPKTGGILFLGSSTIELWKSLERDFPGLPVAQRGIGACTLDQVAGYAKRLATAFQPTTVVIYAGENDLAGRGATGTPEQVLDAFNRTVTSLHTLTPKPRLIFLSLKSSPKRAASQKAFDRTNTLIAAACTRLDVRYLDINPALHDENGEVDKTLYVKDMLHLNPVGYAKLAEVVRPVLTQP